MILAGVDFETTGLDLNSLRVIEIGAALWDTDRRAPVALFSKFVKLPEGEKVPAEITAINGIIDDDLLFFGSDHSRAFSQLVAFLAIADYLVGHNALEFDRPILLRDLQKFAPDPKIDRVRKAKWVDTSVDVPYPKGITTRKLEFLCASHGFLNPFSHRAIFDVVSTLKLLSQYPLDQVLELAAQPNIRIWAGVSFDEKQKAKDRGYRWDKEQKIWTKTIKACHLEEERAGVEFAVNVINENWQEEPGAQG